MAVLRGDQAVHNFVERAVSAACDHELTTVGGGALCDLGGVAGAARLDEFRFDAAGRKNSAHLIEQRTPPFAAVAGVRVVDQQRVAKVTRHGPSWVLAIL